MRCTRRRGSWSVSVNSGAPEGPACGRRLAGRVSEGVSVSVWGTRKAEGAERGRERSACRGPRTLTPDAHAGRTTLVAFADATAHGPLWLLRQEVPSGSAIESLAPWLVLKLQP